MHKLGHYPVRPPTATALSHKESLMTNSPIANLREKQFNLAENISDEKCPRVFRDGDVAQRQHSRALRPERTVQPFGWLQE